ncbi:hypothetical protein H5410_060248 [Solanum commersonii]|uniref:Uncharacterized protein n=1 Tax=Solanum commersonii TaxID=4109 RepID=A0A9J5W4P4_SOLCO|nr:hypothetical protein H5410_060248 [Solanum commersonii]
MSLHEKVDRLLTLLPTKISEKYARKPVQRMFYYPRPTPQDVLLEEHEHIITNSYNGKWIVTTISHRIAQLRQLGTFSYIVLACQQYVKVPTIRVRPSHGVEVLKFTPWKRVSSHSAFSVFINKSAGYQIQIPSHYLAMAHSSI